MRDEVRDLLKESEAQGNYPNSTLNQHIEYATQRIESDFISDEYDMKPRQMLARASGLVTSSGFALPSDLLKPKTVRIGSRNFRYTSLENISTESSQVDSTVNLVYWKKLEKLVNDTETNWLLDIASRVYVYATAIEYTYWNKESVQDRAEYMKEYGDCAATTARANAPQPSTGFGRSSDHIAGYYSIDADYIVFGQVY